MDDAIRYTEYMRHFEAQNRGGESYISHPILRPLYIKKPQRAENSIRLFL